MIQSYSHFFKDIAKNFSILERSLFYKGVNALKKPTTSSKRMLDQILESRVVTPYRFHSKSFWTVGANFLPKG